MPGLPELNMEPHFQFFRGSRIKYYTCGAGEPLFLIHGYQADSSIWEKMVPFLQDTYELIIPDLPGHGHSPLIKPTNTMEFLAEVVFSIALARGFKGIRLAGHSMGGYVALAFAAKYPNMTDGIILLNAHPFEDSMNKTLSRNREAELILQGKKELLLRGFIQNNFSPAMVPKLSKEIDHATKLALTQPEDGMLADLSGMMVRTNKVKVLQKARYSVDFIVGADDTKFPVKEMKNIKLPKAKFHWIQDCGHMSLLEKPEEAAKIITQLQ